MLSKQQVVEAIRRGSDSQVKALVVTYTQDEINRQLEIMKQCSAAFIETKEENLRKAYLQAMGAHQALKEWLTLFKIEKEKNDG